MYNFSIQGGYLGNAGGLNQLIAGGPDLPFGGGGRYRTIQEQYRPGQRSNDPVPTPQTAGFDRKYVY